MTARSTLPGSGMEDETVQRLFEQLTATNNEMSVLHRELTQKTRALEDARKLNNQFLGMAAHDLRNPLHVIGGMSRVLLRSTNISDKERKLLQSIVNSSGFMGRLVDDLLQVSELDAGVLYLTSEPFLMQDLVTERVELQRPIAAEKNIAIETRFAASIPAINGDRMRLSQVIDNLVSNAIKYSQPDTTTTIQVRARGGELWVSVRDRGQGIARNDLGKLFQAFSVTGTRATGGEKSTGLGLLIVKRIVDAHGGSVKVRSRLGVGTTFHVVLPIA